MLDTSSVAAAEEAGFDLSAGGRRGLFFGLVAATTVALIWLAAVALSPGGFDAVDLLLLLLYAITLPWLVIGLWNSVIGFCLMRFARHPVTAIFPGAERICGEKLLELLCERCLGDSASANTQELDLAVER